MRKRVLAGIAAVAAGILIGMPVCAQEEPISDGVFIGDKNVGGMMPDEAAQYVKNEVATLGSTTVTITMGGQQTSATFRELGFSWENTDLVDEISQIGTSGNIIERYKEQKDLQNESAHYEIEYTMDESREAEFVNSCSQFNSDPVEGSLHMGDDGYPYVEGGTDGLTLDADATLAQLKEVLSGWKDGDGNVSIEATVTRTSPALTQETLSKMTDVLGTATTDYSASSAGRAQNVENGTSKINGTLLMPGESFSVTAAVTPFTPENGYELAPSYEAGQVVDSYGGGICQVSTTLYNAVLKSELEVDARSNHTMLVGYVDPSKEYPIYIVGSAYYGTLNFTIFGVETRPSNRSISFESKVTSQTDPAQNIKLVAKTDQNIGYLYQAQTPHQGMTAELWKNIYVDGELTDSVQVNSSYYQESPAIYEVGVVSSNQAAVSAMYTAIANNDLNQVQNIITYGVQQQTETPQTQAPQTNAPQTDAPQTDAPQSDGTGGGETQPDGGTVQIIQ